MLARRAASLPSTGPTVAWLRVDLFTTLGRSDRAVAVGLDYLRRVGIDWSAHPTDRGGPAGIRADLVAARGPPDRGAARPAA